MHLIRRHRSLQDQGQLAVLINTANKVQEPNAPAEEQAAWSAPGGGAAAGAPPVDQPGGEVWPIDPASQARPLTLRY